MSERDMSGLRAMPKELWYSEWENRWFTGGNDVGPRAVLGEAPVEDEPRQEPLGRGGQPDNYARAYKMLRKVGLFEVPWVWRGGKLLLKGGKVLATNSDGPYKHKELEA